MVICKYSLSVFNFVFQKCWHHGCVHAPSGCQMPIDFFAFRGCENWAWSTHCKYNFFIDLCKKSSLQNFCASLRCLVIERLLRKNSTLSLEKAVFKHKQWWAKMDLNFLIFSLFIMEVFFIFVVCCKDGGLYNRLYLCLYDLVADLVRLANGDSIAKYELNLEILV